MIAGMAWVDAMVIGVGALLLARGLAGLAVS